jgi:hydroxypyruvate isomerase
VAIHGLRFDVNCSILFTELPLLKRPTAARAAGFDAVEFWWPFAEPVPADREVDAFIGSLGDADDIAHIQVADVPGRGAPGTGELDFEALFGQLAAQGYRGWIGLEYQPHDPADSSTSFGWRKAHAG